MLVDWKIGVNNSWAGRDGHSPVAIVDHCMSRTATGELATMEGTLSWFRNPKSEVSAHFGVGRDGRVWQFVQMRDTAWANGIVQEPDLTIPWLAEAIKNKVNPNYLTISIEHEGDGIMPMPELQYQSTLALHQMICDYYKIPVDIQHIIRHSQITGVDRAHCPGVSFPLYRLLRELKGLPAMPFDKSFTDPVTQIQVKEPFASYWLKNGGLPIFGRPMTAETTLGTSQFNCTSLQWFERARFENHAGIIALGLVGNEARELAGF